MAATQAEPPVSEPPNMEQNPPLEMDHTSGLQNGEKNKISGISSDPMASKSKLQNNINMEGVHPYRQDGPPGPGPQMNNASEQMGNNGEDPNSMPDNKMYPPTSEPMQHSGYPMGPGYPHPPRGNYHHPEMENSMNQMRHGYKAMPRGPAMGGPINAGFPQQRFISGQSISQPTGPTPTLNQLLQSSNPNHRFQNRYGEPYSPNWAPPRGMPPYGGQQGPPGAYRNQPPRGALPPSPGQPQTGTTYNTTGSTEQPPASPTNPQFTQRYHTPPTRQPYGQHPYGPQGPGQPGASSYDPQQRQQQQQPQQPWPTQQSPHPPQSQSPHAPQASPQSPQQQQQHQSRPQQSPTPNPHAPDPADITGQNSNDSTGAPSTPTSQNMRPTPSPTNSAGSRSVSPAVGNYGPRPPSNMPQYGGYNTQGPPGSQYSYHVPHGQFPGPGQGGYQHNFNSGMPPSPSGYPNNPHHPMGPPMGPPGSTVPNSHPHEAMHPPSVPNSHVQIHSESSSDSAGPPPGLHDNGYGSSSGGSMVNVSQASAVTSIVTTGPDGTPIDEASQQSTLSNASAASGEDPSSTPKRRECGPSPNASMLSPMGWGPNRHPPAPNMPPHSPGTGNTLPMNSVPEEFTPTPTPTWQQRSHSSHKHDSLSKLFDMDDSPERRVFLERLLTFMEERGSPITTCPTISKNLLDLFRLYLLVKERGGFLEVCRVNKNKVWKDIAGLLNIGASSSAAYTLRKHYTKNILPFECHFDRGGVDPQPIINQVEAATKKKGSKAAPTVPSPGSSNSQDSFPSSAGGSMDGYGGYGYPPDFNNQRPPSQPPQNYQGQGYPPYPDQYNQQYPPNRAVYPYGPEGDRSYSQGPGQGGPAMGQSNQPGMPPQQEFRGSYMAPNQAGYPPRGAYPGPGVNQPTPGVPPASGVSQQFPPGAPPNQSNQPPGTPQVQDYFRQDGPRRHPDFSKDQQPSAPQTPQQGYSSPGSYPQQRPMYPGWPGNQASNQYRGPGYPPQQWNQGPPRPSGPAGSAPPATPQWDQNRSYPPNSQSSFPPQQPAWTQNNSGMRMMGPRMDARTSNDPSKPFPSMPPTAIKPGQAPIGIPAQPPQTVKREIQFPPDSIESVTPVLYKRRRLGRTDVAPVEAWRLMMALKSGLLAETSWAIDILNILLCDDTGFAYFGLSHLPGLLDILLEHFKQSLSEMLETDSNQQRKWYEKPKSSKEIPDLGIAEIPEEKVVTSNLPAIKLRHSTIETRRKAATFVESPDLFVKDGPRKWESFPLDEEGGESDTSYITPCFRSEFGNVPFVRVMEAKAGYIENEKESNRKASNCVNNDVKTIVKTEPGLEERSVSKDSKVIEPVDKLKKRRLSDYEDESYCRDEASLYPVSDSQDTIARRCIALSNILRNLTFVPGNETEFAKNSTFLRLLGRLILVYHEHGLRAAKTRNYEREDETDWADCCSSLSPRAESEWWWDYIESVRENVLVSIANIAGHVDLDQQPEDIVRPLLDGLLHWSVCPAAQGQDPFPSSSCNLSPQRLALEALCKLCVTDNNVDLVIATPPYSRLERLTNVLTRFLCRSEDQVLREFAINLLHYLAAADSAMARTVALQSPCISLLVAFIEQAEQNALGVANQHGIGALRDNPDTMGTSLDMLRRAARTLLHLARHPDNRSLFLQQEQRLLALVMSQILDQQVAAVLSRVLYQTRPDLYQNR